MANLPRIGHESNTAFPAFQLNITTAELPRKARGEFTLALAITQELNFV
jgi:hypothetical protein